MAKRRMRWLAGLGGMLVLVVGCSSTPTNKPVFPTHGRLMYEGKPMGKATIIFTPVNEADRDLQSHALTDADGYFTLSSYVNADGAPAGEYIVAINWPGPPGRKGKAKPPEDGADPEEDTAVDYLKNKYWPANVSKLRATVKAEPDNEINFTLP